MRVAAENLGPIVTPNRCRNPSRLLLIRMGVGGDSTTFFVCFFNFFFRLFFIRTRIIYSGHPNAWTRAVYYSIRHFFGFFFFPF